MIVGVRSGMVLMLGLRRERLGRRGRCPRPVVRPVAFIGAIHLQGRISSTRPEESLPPSTHGDTKDCDTDMATLIPGRIRDTLDSDSLFLNRYSASWSRDVTRSVDGWMDGWIEDRSVVVPFSSYYPLSLFFFFPLFDANLASSSGFFSFFLFFSLPSLKEKETSR